MNLKKEDFYKLEKAIKLLEDIGKDMTAISDINTIITNASDVISALNDKYNSKDKKRVKPFVLDKRHINYLNEVKEELIKAEQTIDDIKNNAEWKKVINYFNSYYTRGKLKTRPSKDNGYTYELNDSYYVHKKPLSQNYVDYLIETRARLIKAEEVVDKIKKSDEWKKCQNYFILCEHRDLLECRPTKKNGYTVKVKDFSNNV